MDLDNLIDSCTALENTVLVMVKSNTERQVDLDKLLDCILEKSQEKLEQMVDREEEIRKDLEALKTRRQNVEFEVRGLNKVNEKLTELVTLLQTAGCEETGSNNDQYLDIASMIQGYEQLKIDQGQVMENYNMLLEQGETCNLNIGNIRKEHTSLATSVQQNYNTLRITESLNRCAEKQFDLILSELPWEPLNPKYLSELQDSNNPNISNLAQCLSIQTNEINDLMEALNDKKHKKLRLLDQLGTELNTLLKNRDQAVVMTKICVQDREFSPIANQSTHPTSR